jgi:hypothetical protein
VSHGPHLPVEYSRHPRLGGNHRQRKAVLNPTWEGKFFVDALDGRRKRVSVYGDTEREALAELNKLRDQKRRGVAVATTTLTVADYMSYWLEHIGILRKLVSHSRTWAACSDFNLRLPIPGMMWRRTSPLIGRVGRPPNARLGAQISKSALLPHYV